MIRKYLILSAIAFTISMGIASAQSNIVGRIDNDGVVHMNVDKNKAVEVIGQATAGKISQEIQISDVSFSRMALGEICLTGYEKDRNGKVVKGVRIQCYQDDANNLIIKPGNKIENIFGRPFSDNLVVSE
jgi:hypothetical protein